MMTDPLKHQPLSPISIEKRHISQQILDLKQFQSKYLLNFLIYLKDFSTKPHYYFPPTDFFRSSTNRFCLRKIKCRKKITKAKRKKKKKQNKKFKLQFVFECTMRQRKYGEKAESEISKEVKLLAQIFIFFIYFFHSVSSQYRKRKKK